MNDPGNRNSDGTFTKGVSGNPSGRPKSSLKSYVRNKFEEMTDEQKEEFIQSIPPEIVWRMGEGNPQNDVTSGGKEIQVPIYGGQSISGHDSDKKDLPA